MAVFTVLAAGRLPCFAQAPAPPPQTAPALPAVAQPPAPLAAVDLSTVKVPAPRREFRGVWIATVGNDNWPSRPDLTPDQQRVELLVLLDRAKELNLNAILLQVRPACDALYSSTLEPWSPYLTGAMGVAPNPPYDPLAFAVTEAHKRGLELHAWFNPFRVMQTGEAEKFADSADHVSRTHPEWVRAYGRMLWLDPGVPAARDYSLAVIADVVRRYDIDGIHIDDYFYPYEVTDADHNVVDFPDDVSFAVYTAGGGKLARADWRRSNIDDFVQRLYTSTKAVKPWVKVGISPFGIWRPGNPAQIKGLDSYDALYGDSRRWLHEGWLDYLSPQLYWRIEQTPQSFPVLLSWWLGENTMARHIWPGLYTDLAARPGSRWPQEEIEYQIKTTRGFAGATGDVHFSAAFLRSGDVATATGLPYHLFQTVYSEPALVPASPWLDNGASAPAAPAGVTVTPAVSAQGLAGWNLTWSAPTTAAGTFLVQWRIGGQLWRQSLVWGDTQTFFLPAADPTTAGGSAPALPDVAAVSALDRAGVAGPPAIVAIPATIPAAPALPAPPAAKQP